VPQTRRKKRRSGKRDDAPAVDRSKYTEKPVAAVSAEEKEKGTTRPAKGSVAPAAEYPSDEGFPPLGDDGFPPISGSQPRECPLAEPELPSPIEMSILPAEGQEDKNSDKIGHSKRRSSFTRHRSRERSASDKDEEKEKKEKEKKDKSDKVGGLSSSKRRSKPKFRGSDEKVEKDKK